MIHVGFSDKIVDVETAFLYGDLEEEIYIECPQIISNMENDDCVMLNKSIYKTVLQGSEEIGIHWRHCQPMPQC